MTAAYARYQAARDAYQTVNAACGTARDALATAQQQFRRACYTNAHATTVEAYQQRITQLAGEFDVFQQPVRDANRLLVNVTEQVMQAYDQELRLRQRVIIEQAR